MEAGMYCMKSAKARESNFLQTKRRSHDAQNITQCSTEAICEDGDINNDVFLSG